MSDVRPADNLFAALAARFTAHPDRVCLRVPGGPSRTCADLEGLSARFAGVLAARGVGPGDRVVAQVDKSPAAVALYLGCLRLGAVYVPLNTAYTSAELRDFLEDAEPALCVCRPGDRDRVAADCGPAALATLGATGDGGLEAEAAACDPLRAVHPAGPDDLASIIYTSGTTGRAKGAMLTHRNLLSNALTLLEIWGWRDDDVLLHALPIFHVHGLFVALHTALLNGSTILFLPRFDAGAVRAALPQATVMMGVPTYYTRLLDLPAFGRDDCENMRLFISGSAPLPARIFDDFVARSGHRILERYGMSETGMITSNPLEGERLAGTVGYPLPGVEVRVTDDAGVPVRPGTTGSIEVRGPNVFRGYWRRPERTASEFRDDGFFVTGDLGSLDAGGRLTIAGRSKDLIISGGLNVYPKEVEARIDALPGVVESAVIGVPDADFGEGVIAVVVADTAPADEAAFTASLREALDGRLARFKQPRRCFIVDRLPRNAMGKVQKHLLRERYADVLQKA